MEEGLIEVEMDGRGEEGINGWGNDGERKAKRY